MEPVKEQNGWQIHTGLAAFQKEGLSGVALLTTATAGGKMVNILLVTNTDVFKNEIQTFLSSVKLPETVAKTSESPVREPVRTPGSSKGKAELWSVWRLTNTDPLNGASILKRITDIYAVYPDGDYFPHVPYEGLEDLDRSYQAGSWGKFTIRGNKGRFKNNYEDIPVTKRSAYTWTRTVIPGLFQSLSVDGLRIEGAYTHVSPDWGKDPKLNYLSGLGCQFVINFKKDGTFDDRGIFSTNLNNCTGGKGTYSIENFTITFRYSDGRVVRRLFTAPPTRNPATYTETYYIGHTAHYKKMN